MAKHKQPSIISEALSSKKTLNDVVYEKFKVSFEYLDSSQKYGSGFKDWQKEGLLSKMMETLKGYCCNTLESQSNTDKFTIYGDFPSSDKTLFNKPTHVPEDARWGRIHVTGPAVVVGHIVRGTFYVVFLDKTHKFWLTKRDQERYK